MNAMIEGGVVVDCAGLSKPVAVLAVIKRAKDYIETMNLVRKPARRVVLARGDYDRVFDAAVKARSDGMPNICGLTICGVPLERQA